MNLEPAFLSFNLLTALSLSAVLLSVLLLLLGGLFWRRQKIKLTELSQRVQNLQQHNVSEQLSLQEQLLLTKKLTQGMQAQLQALQEELQSYSGLRQQQQEHEKKISELRRALQSQVKALRDLAEQEPEMKFYQRAARMVQQGASLEEVIESCEIPQAEAELLFSLYKKP